MASQRRMFLAGVLGAVIVAAVPSRAQAGGGEFGPSEEETAQARKLAAKFRRGDGVQRAFRVLCGANEVEDVQRRAAFTVLVERAAAMMPKLLDAIAAGAVDDERWECAEESSKIAVSAVCHGRDLGDIHDVDRRSDNAVERSRVAAQVALVRGLAKAGARRGAAIDVLLRVRASGFEWERMCRDGEDAVRLATGHLVKMLAAKEREEDILRLFASGGGDAAVAVPALRPYLADEKRLPLAATALARLSQDMSQVVGPLAELVDGADVAVVLEALEALESIGSRATGALPRLAALSKRIDASCTRPVPVSRLVETVGAIAWRPEDAGITLEMLSPLLRCSSTLLATGRVISRFRPEGREVLLAYFRDDGKEIEHRLEIASVLQVEGGDDAELLQRLYAKKARHFRPHAQEVMPEPKRDLITVASEEINACRSEAGLEPIALTGVGVDQGHKLLWCLQKYLCGPSRGAFERTLDRCCEVAFGGQEPSICRP